MCAVEHALVISREREGERWGAEGLWVGIVGAGFGGRALVGLWRRGLWVGFWRGSGWEF